MNSFVRAVLVGTLLLSVAETAMAQTLVQRRARIASLTADNVAAASNFDYRLYLQNITDLAGNPVTTLCSATPGADFVYVNVPDRNYRAMVTAMTLAKAIDAQVMVTVETVPFGTSTYCHLLDLVF